MTGRIPIGTLCRAVASQCSYPGALCTVVGYDDSGRRELCNIRGQVFGPFPWIYFVEPDDTLAAVPGFEHLPWAAAPGWIEPLPPPPKVLQEPRQAEA